jgi:hypothetical protein
MRVLRYLHQSCVSTYNSTTVRMTVESRYLKVSKDQKKKKIDVSKLSVTKEITT